MTNGIEFWKDFSEEVFTVSIHPAGHQILAGFSDKLRLLNILIDDFRVVREFPIRGFYKRNKCTLHVLFLSIHFEIFNKKKDTEGKVLFFLYNKKDQNFRFLCTFF